jgi:hypothetical protein
VFVSEEVKSAEDPGMGVLFCWEEASLLGADEVGKKRQRKAGWDRHTATADVL